MPRLCGSALGSRENGYDGVIGFGFGIESESGYDGVIGFGLGIEIESGFNA